MLRSGIMKLEIDQPVRVVAKSITEKVFEGFVKRIAPLWTRTAAR